MRVRSSSDESLLLRWAGFAFGRARRRVGGQQGVAPSPASPPHASALAAPHRVGPCLLGSCMQQNWRGLILVGVLFSSEKEQVKVKLQLT